MMNIIAPLNFEATITIENERYTFRFSKIISPGKPKFFVSSYSIRGRSGCFDMQENNYGNWKVVQPCPDWIVKLEARLSLIITQNSSKQIGMKNKLREVGV
ncbi:MAG TPA: hypothetical protein VGO09_08325 [Flavisolibacter sp.]|jgi:hypothetical protein|nr:hypothetical protein [Flavisolibacter sp.]